MQHRIPLWRYPSQVTASNSSMCRPVRLLFALALICTTGTACAEETPTTAAVMEALTESDWRRPDPANLLYMRLPQGEIVLELAPGFAPENVTNIKLLVAEKYFDDLAIIRSQDNYVVQWGDPAGEEDAARSFGTASATVPPEFVRSAKGISIRAIDSRDSYADTVGFVAGFPSAVTANESG